MSLYLEAYGDAVDRHFARDLPDDLRGWTELLSRHHRSLRRPLATGRPRMAEDDGEREAGEGPRPTL